MLAKISKFVYDERVRLFRSLFLIFFFIGILLLSLLTSPSPSHATSWCLDHAVSSYLDQANNYNTVLKVKRNNFKGDETYSIFVPRANIIRKPGTYAQGEITFELGKLIPGNYGFDISVLGTPACGGGATFEVPDEGQGGTVTVKKGNITFNPANPTSDDPIIITVTNLPQEGEYAVFLSNPAYAETFAKYPELKPEMLCAQSSNQSVNFTARALPRGTWDVIVTKKAKNVCSIEGDRIAEASVSISTSSLPAPTLTENPSSLSPCAEWIYSYPTESPNFSKNGLKINDDHVYDPDFKDRKCILVNTAVGNISTNPAEFVKSIFSLVLGLAGGIALILIMVSGYKFMTSGGNPEAVKGATEQLTSAIIGLLFIIFSFVILEIIGVDILRIPGFAE